MLQKENKRDFTYMIAAQPPVLEHLWKDRVVQWDPIVELSPETDTSSIYWAQLKSETESSLRNVVF
jgi:hypothetical protein